MGWLDEAEAILKQKSANQKANDGAGENPQNPEVLTLDTEQGRKAFRKEVKAIYENATDREIDLAIERIEAKFTPPYSKKELLSYVRQFVDGD